MASRKRAAKEPLTRERAVAAAIALADRAGIDALSMRSLAKALGVEAMSLYHHVANKDEILDGMVDAVYAEFATPVVGAPWRAEMERRAWSVREVVNRHRWAILLLGSRRNPGTGTLRHHDAVIGCLRKDGFSLLATAHAFAVIDAYLYGFLIQELTLPFESAEQTQELAEEIVGSMSVEEFPHLAELAMEHVMRPGYDFGEEFGYGLALVLDGLARERATSES